MSTKHTRRRALFAAALIAITGGLAITVSTAQADNTGATATKDCAPAPAGGYTVGSVIPCNATFINAGALPAQITDLFEQAPFIGPNNVNNGVPTNLSCSTDGGATTKTVGDTLDPGSNPPPVNVCSIAFQVPVPNNPALCNTNFRDMVQIGLIYPSGLTAGAFATNTVRIVCHPSITVTKTADTLSKPTDPVNFHIQVCNTSLITVTKTSVDDPLISSVNAAFGATIAPSTCESHDFSRLTDAADPDPLVNTVTANYTNGITGIFAEAVSATASSSTNLFQPSVAVSKSCGPNPSEVGGTENCTITVHNTSSSDAPTLVNGTITDSLNGNLLAAGNPAVVSSTCGPTLAVGASCVIQTARVILATDPNPVVNTVVVHYNPEGFPNDITATASASVVTVVPSITVIKSADTLSKPGDPITYTITVCNTGPLDVAPNSVTDSLQGDLTAAFHALASTDPDSCQSLTYQRTVLPGDPDPLVNTVTAVYSSAHQVAGASASATTNLFQPGVGVTKNCGPDPIAVGQVENCTIVVTNTSSADAPGLVNGAITDTLSGNLLDAGNTAIMSSTCTVALATGGSCQIVTHRTVLATDPTPLVNTVAVHYNPQGFPNNINASASANVHIVAPHITLAITADSLSKVTDDVTFTITVCNDGPIAVTRNSLSGTVLGNLNAQAPASLAPGQCVTFSIVRTTVAGDPDPLVVTATANYSGLGVSATATSSSTTNLFQPGVAVTKTCSPNPITVGQAELCTITVTNTSSADSPNLGGGTISDTLSGNLLAAGNTAVVNSTCTTTLATGASCVIHTTRTVLATDVSPLVNTVSVLYHPVGFPNNIAASATASVTIQVVTTGCTPGFWKQSQHFSSWVGYTPNQSFNTVFGVTFTNKTLLQALQANGGGDNAFLRFAVNALLDASSTSSPDFSTAQVIALVQAAIAPGNPTIAQVTQQFSSAPGVTSDNCKLIRPS